MFFKQLYQEGAIPNNPMALIDMTKKDNYLAVQNKEAYSLLKMFFKLLYQEGAIPNNPMALIDMTKKDNDPV